MYGLTTLHCVFPPVFPNVCVDMYSIPRSAFDTMLVMRIHPFAVAASLAFHGCAPAEKDAIASGSLLEELDPEMIPIIEKFFRCISSLPMKKQIRS